ncbi:hypothetical protein M5D96_011364, partial [Drosophila gunungcola]
VRLQMVHTGVLDSASCVFMCMRSMPGPLKLFRQISHCGCFLQLARIQLVCECMWFCRPLNCRNSVLHRWQMYRPEPSGELFVDLVQIFVLHVATVLQQLHVRIRQRSTYILAHVRGVGGGGHRRHPSGRQTALRNQLDQLQRLGAIGLLDNLQGHLWHNLFEKLTKLSPKINTTQVKRLSVTALTKSVWGKWQSSVFSRSTFVALAM